MRVNGAFVIKEGANGDLSLAFQAGGEQPFVTMPLRAGTTLEYADTLKGALNLVISSIGIEQ